MTRNALAAAVALTTLSFASASAHAQRAIGIDVSYWQGPSINWSTVAKPQAEGGGGITFAFIRATRGRPFADDTTPFVDDYYASNIANAKAAGIMAGAYHYARFDVNDALEEANDFLSVARYQMGAGYLRPVLDIEQTNSMSKAALSTWALTFSDRIYEVTKVRPIIYVNSNFAINELDGTTASPTTGITLPQHDLWLARYTLYDDGNAPRPTVQDAIDAAIEAQTYVKPTTSYGIFKTASNPVPWDFWQYTNAGRTPGISGYVDQNVANGGIEFVRDFVAPAIWTDTAGGNFGGGGKWNNYEGVAGTLFFPDANTRATINVAGTPTITYNGMDRTVRSLQSDEAMSFLRGTLTGVQYLNFTAAVTVGKSTADPSGFTAPTISNNGTLTMTAGTVAAVATSYGPGAITGTGSITVGGTGALSAVTLTQSALTVTGGTASVTGAVTTTGAVNVSGGTLNLGSLSTTNALIVTGNGRANFTGTGGSKVAGLTATASTSGGAVNLSLIKLAIDHGNAVTSSTPAQSVRNAIAAGGLVSNKSIAGVTGVGYAEATKALSGFTSGTRTWNGVTVDTTTLLVQLALLGDTNLDNTVNLADLANLAASYMQAGLWQQGDATYDGLVNKADLDLLGANYGKTLLADGTVTGGNPQQFAIDVQGFPNLVPEPASLAMLAPLAVALRRRRRA